MIVRGPEGAFLRSVPLFSGLPEEDMGVFVKAATRTYKKGEYICRRGDQVSCLHVIVEGWIRLGRETLDGDEMLSDMLTSGGLFDEGVFFYQSGSHIFSAQAVTESRLLEIPAGVLWERADANPDILKRAMESVCRKMIRLQIENEQLAGMSAPQRVACLLLRLSSSMLGQGGTFTFPYEKSLAAAQLGMKRETFSRSLVQLKEMGVSVSGSEVKIESFERLTEFCCRHCTLAPGECSGARFMPPLMGDASASTSHISP